MRAGQREGDYSACDTDKTHMWGVISAACMTRCVRRQKLKSCAVLPRAQQHGMFLYVLFLHAFLPALDSYDIRQISHQIVLASPFSDSNTDFKFSLVCTSTFSEDVVSEFLSLYEKVGGLR